jgi:membrane protease YdiL (CAAX protease family)
MATGPTSRPGRLFVLAEVCLGFCLVHVAYRSFKHFTQLGQAEGAAGLNFSPGVTMTLFALAMVWLTKRSFKDYGFVSCDWRADMTVGVFWAILLVAAGAAFLALAPERFDPIHPPDLFRSVVASAGQLLLVVALVVVVRSDSRPVPRWLVVASTLFLLAVLAAPSLVAWWFDRPPGRVLLGTLWLFFGAGFGEEVFFRGYVQSRVDQAFGQPFRLRGIAFGPGLIVSALLFGLIHALNTVDYFEGRWTFAWLWVAPNVVTGLFVGWLRQARQSIYPGAIVHGVSDVLGRIPGLMRGVGP